MNTEDTKADFNALLRASGILAGLSGVASPDVPFTAAAPLVLGAEEAARKFTYDMPVATKASLTLVADQGEGNAVDAEKLSASKGRARNDIQAAIANTMSEDRKKDLRDLLDRVDTARNPGEIAALLANMGSNAASADDRAETPQAKADRLLGDVRDSNKDLNNAWDKADPYLTEEQRKRKKEDQKASNAAIENLDQVMHDSTATDEQKQAALKQMQEAVSAQDAHAKETANYLREHYPNDPAVLSIADEIDKNVQKSEKSLAASPDAVAAVKAAHANDKAGDDDLSLALTDVKEHGPAPSFPVKSTSSPARSV